MRLGVRVTTTHLTHMCVCVDQPSPASPAFQLMQNGATVWIRYATTQVYLTHSFTLTHSLTHSLTHTPHTHTHTHTQWDSRSGLDWRRVSVVRFGHLSETDLSRSTDPSDVGWWCRDRPGAGFNLGTLKFFVKDRIISIRKYLG